MSTMSTVGLDHRLKPTIFARGKYAAGLIGGFALALNGCTYPSTPDRSPDRVAVEGVRVVPQSIQFTAVGETKAITATLVPDNATDQTIIWDTTDPSIATVDESGRVTAKAAGAAVFVTASTRDGHFQASVNVSVNP